MLMNWNNCEHCSFTHSQSTECEMENLFKFSLHWCWLDAYTDTQILCMRQDSFVFGLGRCLFICRIGNYLLIIPYTDLMPVVFVPLLLLAPHSYSYQKIAIHFMSPFFAGMRFIRAVPSMSCIHDHGCGVRMYIVCCSDMAIAVCICWFPLIFWSKKWRS